MLTLFYLLALSFAPNETKENYYYQLNLRVASRVLNDLKLDLRKLGNFRKTFALAARIIYCPFSLQKMEI